MEKAKKILALLLCAVLLVGASIAGTMAYLTDTKAIENTFTIGKVKIKLDEATVDPESGKAITTAGRTVEGNKSIRMIPGREIDKDPVVRVLKDSEDCYVRVVVTVSVPSWDDADAKAAKLISDNETFATWAERFAYGYLRNNHTSSGLGFNEDNWTLAEPNYGNNTITYTLTYKNASTENIVEKNSGLKDAEDNTVLEAVFDKVTVPAALTNDQLALLADMSIEVEAHAIQAAGFEASTAPVKTAEQAAWDAFDAQNP